MRKKSDKKCASPYSMSQKFLPVEYKCRGKATRRRKTWRWGRGTNATIPEVVNLCDGCTVLWDEAAAEARWEARVS